MVLLDYDSLLVHSRLSRSLTDVMYVIVCFSSFYSILSHFHVGSVYKVRWHSLPCRSVVHSDTTSPNSPLSLINLLTLPHHLLSPNFLSSVTRHPTWYRHVMRRDEYYLGIRDSMLSFVYEETCIIINSSSATL